MTDAVGKSIFVQACFKAFHEQVNIVGIDSEDLAVRTRAIMNLSRAALGFLEVEAMITKPDFVKPRAGGNWHSEEVIARGAEEVKVKRDNKNQQSRDNFGMLIQKIEECGSPDELEEFEAAYAEQLIASPYQDELTAAYETRKEILRAI